MLDAIESLFDELDHRDLAYCNWKSNKRLADSLAGDIDVELLCNPDDREAVEEALRANGYVEFVDVRHGNFPGITNFIGYDEPTGSLIHVHLHFQLTFGTPYSKEYATPWGEYVLETRIRDEDTGVWIADPHVEQLLLLVRYAFKIRRLNVRARRSYYSEFRKEYDWLDERTTTKGIREAADDLLSPAGAALVEELVDGETAPSIGDFHRLRSVVAEDLAEYNRFSPIGRRTRPLFHKGLRGLGRVNRRWLRLPRPTRRATPDEGIVVAVIGIDGSGKSTVLGELEDWLSWKVDVHTVYFGSGDGRSSVARYPLKLLNKARTWVKYRRQRRQRESEQQVRTNGDGATEPVDIEELAKPESNTAGPLKGLWAVLLAREKRQKRTRAHRARRRGMIVLCDRYPQARFPGRNDGPLLGSWADRPVLGRIADWEARIYEQLHDDPPDLVVKLEVDPQVAKERKPETQLRELKQKATIIEAIDYDGCRVVTVDASQELDAVVDRVKEVVWGEMA